MSADVAEVKNTVKKNLMRVESILQELFEPIICIIFDLIHDKGWWSIEDIKTKTKLCSKDVAKILSTMASHKIVESRINCNSSGKQFFEYKTTYRILDHIHHKLTQIVQRLSQKSDSLFCEECMQYYSCDMCINEDYMTVCPINTRHTLVDCCREILDAQTEAIRLIEIIDEMREIS